MVKEKERDLFLIFFYHKKGKFWIQNLKDVFGGGNGNGKGKRFGFTMLLLQEDFLIEVKFKNLKAPF